MLPTLGTYTIYLRRRMIAYGIVQIICQRCYIHCNELGTLENLGYLKYKNSVLQSTVWFKANVYTFMEICIAIDCNHNLFGHSLSNCRYLNIFLFLLTVAL